MANATSPCKLPRARSSKNARLTDRQGSEDALCDQINSITYQASNLLKFLNILGNDYESEIQSEWHGQPGDKLFVRVPITVLIDSPSDPREFLKTLVEAFHEYAAMIDRGIRIDTAQPAPNWH